MLIQRQNSKIVFRILKNKTGESFRACFLVQELSGRFFAKLVQLEKIGNSEDFKEKILFLPVEKILSFFKTIKKIFKEAPSFFVTNSNCFFVSQMTRAPSA